MVSEPRPTGPRRRGGWTGQKAHRLAAVSAVLEELRGYWPLTVRQVYYRLVASGTIDNRRAEYQALSKLLSQARIEERVPWDAIEDRSRTMMAAAGWPGAESFVSASLAHFLRDYRRDLLQSQPLALEVWLEKDALSRVCQNAADPYGVYVVVGRGFVSVSYLNTLRERVNANAAAGKQTVILYFGDLDPSGWAMLPTMLETLQGEMGLGDLVSGVRCALTEGQVTSFDLPRNPEALKETDSRARAYREQFGDLAVELDAIDPPDLERLVAEAIQARIDLDLFRAEERTQTEEKQRLASLKAKVDAVVAGQERGA